MDPVQALKIAFKQLDDSLADFRKSVTFLEAKLSQAEKREGLSESPKVMLSGIGRPRKAIRDYVVEYLVQVGHPVSRNKLFQDLTEAGVKIKNPKSLGTILAHHKDVFRREEPGWVLTEGLAQQILDN